MNTAVLLTVKNVCEECVAQERTEQYVNSQNELLNVHAPPFILSREGKPQKPLDRRQESPTLRVVNKEVTKNYAQCMDLAKGFTSLTTTRNIMYQGHIHPRASSQKSKTTPAEGMDLLLLWTGGESSKHVHSIKVTNAGRQVLALERVWKRLDSRYGSHEEVEMAPI